MHVCLEGGRRDGQKRDLADLQDGQLAWEYVILAASSHAEPRPGCDHRDCLHAVVLDRAPADVLAWVLLEQARRLGQAVMVGADRTLHVEPVVATLEAIRRRQKLGGRV